MTKVLNRSPRKRRPGTPGTNSPFRERTPEENLRLFEEMKAGQCQEGERVLRAKIDMAQDNMLMRDPVIYRVKFVEHHRTGNDWVIYPMYDLRTANRIPLNAFRTACVRWSLKITGPSTTGSFKHWISTPVNRRNLPGSI